MEISRGFLLVCAITAIWCFSDMVHSAHTNAGSSKCKSSEKCISIYKCSSLRDLFYQAKRNSTAAAILKEKSCGIPSKFCCPSTTPSVTTSSTTSETTPSPTPVTTPSSTPSESTPSTTPSESTPSTPSVTTPSTAGNFNECGKSKKVVEQFHKIVGGENATLGSWPWMVALYLPTGRKTEPKFELQCGASLISRQWVITAAHCVNGINKSAILLGLGDLDIDVRVKDGASPINVTIDKIVKHPEATEYPKPATNDIALLRLKKPVSFTENIRPVCLLSGKKYKTNEYYERKQAFVTGWGTLGEKLKQSYSRLQETTVNVTSLEKCARQYSQIQLAHVDDNVICARAPGRDTCKGDSGGPFMLFNEGRFYLAGITSGGKGCARADYPGIYTKVAQYISWINKVTGENF